MCETTQAIVSLLAVYVLAVGSEKESECVILHGDATAFFASFSSFQDPLNGLTAAKFSRLGQACEVSEPRARPPDRAPAYKSARSRKRMNVCSSARMHAQERTRAHPCMRNCTQNRTSGTLASVHSCMYAGDMHAQMHGPGRMHTRSSTRAHA